MPGETDVTVTLSRPPQDGEVVIVAFYDGENRLIDVKIKKMAVGADDPVGPHAITVPAEKLAEADTVKAFWWESLNTLVPLCRAETMIKTDGVWKKVQ